MRNRSLSGKIKHQLQNFPVLLPRLFQVLTSIFGHTSEVFSCSVIRLATCIMGCVLSNQEIKY